MWLQEQRTLAATVNADDTRLEFGAFSAELLPHLSWIGVFFRVGSVSISPQKSRDQLYPLPSGRRSRRLFSWLMASATDRDLFFHDCSSRG